MNYQEALDYLYSQLPMFHRIGADAYNPSLKNTLLLCKHLGDPQKKFKSVHIAGTNGKGSCSNMIASVLQEAGYKTGLYTSPHLKDFRERFRINGVMIPEEKVIAFIQAYHTLFEEIKPSFFEMTVALAFKHFADEKVDIAIVEVGMGGRLDSTNIINPLLSIITNIGFDHMQFLGNTLEKIAIEKAGIIKKNTPVIISETHPETQNVFTHFAAQHYAPITFADQVWESKKINQTNDELTIELIRKDGTETFYANLDLPGNYQLKNSKAVIECVRQLKTMNFEISMDQLLQGFQNTKKNTGFIGRWFKLSENPLIICDTGHNEDGIIEILKQLAIIPYQKLHWVIGMVSDKDVSKILSLLPKNALYYFCKAQIPRAMEALELQQKASIYQLQGNIYTSVKEALATAKKNAKENDLILIGGSTFVVAEVL